MIQTEPENIEQIRARIRKMSDLELREYGSAARSLADPKKNFCGNSGNCGILRITYLTGTPMTIRSGCCCVYAIGTINKRPTTTPNRKIPNRKVRVRFIVSPNRNIIARTIVGSDRPSTSEDSGRRSQGGHPYTLRVKSISARISMRISRGAAPPQSPECYMLFAEERWTF